MDEKAILSPLCRAAYQEKALSVSPNEEFTETGNCLNCSWQQFTNVKTRGVLLNDRNRKERLCISSQDFAPAAQKGMLKDFSFFIFFFFLFFSFVDVQIHNIKVINNLQILFIFCFLSSESLFDKGSVCEKAK